MTTRNHTSSPETEWEQFWRSLVAVCCIPACIVAMFMMVIISLIGGKVNKT